jgi:transposase
MQTTQEHTDYKVLYEQQQLNVAALNHTVEALKLQLQQLQKMIFGSRSERFVPADANTEAQQGTLGFAVETVAECKVTDAQKITYVRTRTEVSDNKPKAHPGRTKLPDHLRRETIVLLPDSDVTAAMKKIGEEITEVLEYAPGELYVKQYIRPKYVIPSNGINTSVLTAALPGRLLEKSMAGEGLLAQIIVDKYMDHLPLHRQLQRFERAGVTIAQSTINDWVKATLNQLSALYEAHKTLVLSSRYLHADETPLKVLEDSTKNKSHTGYYWVYHNSEDKLVLFDYRPGRGREGPDDILQHFKGYLQTDGYVAYESFEKRPGIVLLHCMAHARRKFIDALTNDQPRAEHALNLFAKLYDTERTIKEQGLRGDEIMKIRESESVPVLEELESWMRKEYTLLPSASTIASAIAYCLPRWKKLSTYTTDPILNIDNNPVENAIRPVAIGRKNYLFAGSHDAAQRAAMVYSLFATCKLHGINPYAWLRSALENMHKYTTSNIAELLPHNWKNTALKS